MNVRAVRAIMRKDLEVVVQSKAVLIPLIVVPLLLFVLLPGLVAFVPALSSVPGSSLGDVQAFLQTMPPGMRAELAGYDPLQQVVVLFLVYLMAPMFLIVPLMVASVISADSFAGEKERKTLEALLYTPTTDRELFLAKILSAWLPAMVVAVAGFVLYGVAANASAWPVMGRIFFPNGMWILLVLWVAPAVAGLGLGTMVLVSSRVNSFQEAYQLGGAIVLPVLFLLVGQATGVMYLSPGLVALIGLVFWGIDVVLFWFGVRTFRRGEIIARL
jgi:ABC-2 type transport system permease protein